MGKPYRWGDVPPESVQRIKERRVYRASEFFARIKRGRAERFAEEQMATKKTSAKKPCQVVALPSPPARCLPEGTA